MVSLIPTVNWQVRGSRTGSEAIRFAGRESRWPVVSPRQGGGDDRRDTAAVQNGCTPAVREPPPTLSNFAHRLRGYSFSPCTRQHTAAVASPSARRTRGTWQPATRPPARPPALGTGRTPLTCARLSAAGPTTPSSTVGRAARDLSGDSKSGVRPPQLWARCLSPGVPTLLEHCVRCLSVKNVML